MKKSSLVPLKDHKERLALFQMLTSKGIRLNYWPTTEELRKLAGIKPV